MKYAIGVDLGGSHTMAAVVDAKGKIQAKFKRDLSSLDVGYVVGEIVHVVGKALKAVKGKNLAGIGLGSPGSIDERNGDIRYSPNFGWRNVPLGKLLAKRLGHRVDILNDARCATLGEADHGSGRGARDFALITLGTGLGGGFIANGKLVIGNAMGAGEVGHHQIPLNDGFILLRRSGASRRRHRGQVSSVTRCTRVIISRARCSSATRRRGDEGGSSDAARRSACRGGMETLIADLAIGAANIVAS